MGKRTPCASSANLRNNLLPRRVSNLGKSWCEGTISHSAASKDWDFFWCALGARAELKEIMRVFRTTFLLVALTLLLMLIGRYFGGRGGMTLALGFAVVMNAFAYFFSDKIALMSSGAKPVSREQLPRLYAVMERLASKANLPVPKLYVVPEPAPNAFATGRNPRHASVAVTQGLLELMSDDELEGVIAHELSHVRNYDILISSIAATIAGAITWIAYWGPYRDDGEGGGGGGLLGLLMMILAPRAAML